jgi:hypothetical protein
MTINFSLLTYEKITDFHWMTSAEGSAAHYRISPDKLPPISPDEKDTFAAIGVYQDMKWTQLHPLNAKKSETMGKFHISMHDDDLPKAWNAVVALIARAEIKAKVASAWTVKYHRERSTDAIGKNIVIYFDKAQSQDKEKYETLLTDIEREFEKAGIRPGPAVKGDKTVAGSKYSYMRYGDTIYSVHTGQAANASDSGVTSALDDIVIPPAVGKWAELRPPAGQEPSGATSPAR